MFNCDIIRKETTSDENYYKEISSHRLCFQCSWSEAFDYQALEYAVMGVPVIGGHCLDWLYKISPKCIVDNIDSCYDIRNVAQYLLDNQKEYWDISGVLYIDAQKMNESNIEDLKQVLLTLENN